MAEHPIGSLHSDAMEIRRLRAGLEYIAKTWANGNGAGPYARKVLDGTPEGGDRLSDLADAIETALGLLQEGDVVNATAVLATAGASDEEERTDV